MFGNIMMIICVLLIIISICTSIKVFNNKNISKKKRTRDAYLELAFAVAIILSFSDNPILIAISVILLIITLGSIIRAFLKARKRAKHILSKSQKINKAIRNNPDLQNEINKIITKVKNDNSGANDNDIKQIVDKIEQKIKEMEKNNK